MSLRMPMRIAVLRSKAFARSRAVAVTLTPHSGSLTRQVPASRRPGVHRPDRQRPCPDFVPDARRNGDGLAVAHADLTVIESKAQLAFDHERDLLALMAMSVEA